MIMTSFHYIKVIFSLVKITKYLFHMSRNIELILNNEIISSELHSREIERNFLKQKLINLVVTLHGFEPRLQQSKCCMLNHYITG